MRALAPEAPDTGNTAAPGTGLGRGPDARVNRRLMLGAGLTTLVLFGAAGVLWMRYGVAIFFDTVVAGLSTCF